MNIETVLMAMPPSWRYRWCEAHVCACMGAANCSGGLRQLGVTKDQWQAWVDAHPDEPRSEETSWTSNKPR